MPTIDHEDQIERAVEKRFDRLDREYMTTDMDREEYDRRSRAIDAWADRQYRVAREARAIVGSMLMEQEARV